jgi:hypothetical protein
MEELEARSPALKGYNDFRRQLERSLVFEIKLQALRGTDCKLFLQTGYDAALAPAVDGFATWAYGERPEKVYQIVRQARSAAPADWRGEFPCFIRLGMGVPSSQEELREIVQALRRGGATGPIFYNYSESPRKMLGWIPGAVGEIQKKRDG